MKKTISGILSLIMTAALFTQGMPITALTVDIPVDIDKGIYDQIVKFSDLNDTNGDGVISEEEFKNIHSIIINLDDVKDISGLAKAENLRCIEITGGSITDFSVLCGLKNLRRITIEKNPIKDISSFKDMNLDYLVFSHTNVSVQDQISMIQAPDIEVPVGFSKFFRIKPTSLLPTELFIKDNEIAGFSSDDKTSQDGSVYNDIIGKKPGETTYSVMYEGQEIATGKIKVVPAQVKDPQSALSGVKVDKIEEIFRGQNRVPGILTEDDKYYNFKDGKFVLVADDVKAAYRRSTDGDNCEYILKHDGSFTIDGKSVFDDTTKVSEICDNYALTDDGSLWYMYKSINPIKICSDCDKIINKKIVSKKDGTVIFIYNDREIYELGKMNIVHVHNVEEKILDDQGHIWNLKKVNNYSHPIVELVAEGAVKLGSVTGTGRAVYATADGKVYYCDNGEENESVTADDVVVKDGYNSVVYTGRYKDDRVYAFMDEATVNGVEVNYNDIMVYGRSLLYYDKTLYLTCLDRYIAVSDVKESWGAYYDKAANDYSILIVRNDNTLWEYRIGADTLTQVTTDSVKTEDPKVTEPPVTTTKAPETTTNTTTTQPEEKLSVSDVISLIRYMTGASTLTDSQVKKYDMNSDGKINLVDIILLKNMILGEK